ncbi:TIM44-like domain-containing protein, partial [Paraconexibacter sp.]|uniref:TIM44-like domain-containing protein n=1 Tax=Paraconexibacter sp. TaxID=2949640 RepID=UPI003562B8F4
MTVALTLLTPILAAAGGGSSGFSGGGGGGFSGGGGSGFSGGGSSGEIGTGGAVFLVAIFVLIAIVLLIGAVSAVRLSRKRRARVAQVVRASAEAAEDDAYFAADVVTSQARELFVTVQHAWSENDVARLRAMVGAELMVEWERRLADFRKKGWRNKVDVQSGPEVEYVGIVNRDDDTEDRVCVRLTATLLDRVVTDRGQTIMRNGQSSATTQLAEYWTLAHRDGRWTLASIESDTEGVHQLDAAIVASPWSDTGALRDEALVESAVADKALDGFATVDLVDVDLTDDARAQALDLSLADARFAPDILEVAARRAVQ